jgi:hypothetical protein
MKRIQYHRYGGPEEMQLEATRGLKIGALSISSPYACGTRWLTHYKPIAQQPGSLLR